MKEPKEIKFVFLLVFLFSLNFIFSQNDSLKAIKKKDNYRIKGGANYLIEDIEFTVINDNYRGSRGSINPVININKKHSMERLGLYFSIGKVNKRSNKFSIYRGLYFLNYKIPFIYTKFASETSSTPTPTNQYKREYLLAEGNIIRNTIGLELNFEITVRNTSFILSPFNPSIIFSYTSYAKRETQSYDVTVAYKYTPPSYYYKYDSIKTLTHVEENNFKMQKPYLPGVIILPFSLGVEQKIPLKKNAILVGAKVSFVINSIKSKSYSYGGQLYAGYEF